MILLASCAQVRSLPGGEKDVMPPKIVSAVPENLTRNFNSKTIVLNFDEYVQLNNLTQELIVSPPLEKQPEIHIKQKSVVIRIKEELKPNTTYQFNFGDAIVDVNENNKAEDLIYVFSTGNQIDSLEVSGKITMAPDDAPAAAYKVLLFENDTSVFAKKSVPLYFARSKEDGSFALDYLREGNFFLYSLDDKNGNYRWDDGESIGKLNHSINPLDSNMIQLFSSVPRPQKISVNEYQTDSVGRILFPLDRYYTETQIQSLDNTPIKQIWIGDTLCGWIQGKPDESKKLVRVHWKDALDDTLQVPFYGEAQKLSFNLSCSASNKLNVYDEIFISSKNLMTLAQKETIEVLQDSLPVPFKLIGDSSSAKFKIDFIRSPGKKYSLQILPGTFVNASQGTNDTLRLSFTSYKPEELGMLNITLKSGISRENCILKLLDKNNRIVYSRARINDAEYVVKDLAPGEYSALIIEDENGNGLFDPIDLKNDTPPEITHIYPGKISVRSNWEVKINWAF